jgi:glucose dehydrogenase/cytochrome c5
MAAPDAESGALTPAPAGPSGALATALIVAAVLAVVLAAVGYLAGYENGKGVDDDAGATAAVAPGEAPSSPAFASSDLAAEPRENWITNGGSLSNQRYSPLDQIDTSNVSELEGVWRSHLDNSGTATKYSGEATPLVYDGVIYTVTGADDVFATSVATGRTIWKYTAKLNPKITTVCCGWTNRGVGMGDGRIYVSRLDGKLVALDQATGEVEWTTNVGDWRDGETVTSAPLYYDGRVYSGVSGGEFGIRGRVTAYDAETGKQDWRFYTIPGPGETGHDTWPADNDSWKHGGAPVWNTPAVDPELGMIYFSTGNASPDLNGSGRPGDNLFTTSIVAVDADTGEYRWHFQEVHHDIWDYDAPSPVVLWDAEIDGETVAGLSQPGKTGWLYMLDRETGEPIHPIEERPVPQLKDEQATAKTQPFPETPPFSTHEVTDAQYEEILALTRKTLGDDVTLDRAKDIFEPFGATGKVLAPGPSGGTNWPPSSYNQETQMVYVCGIDGYAGYLSEGLGKFEPATTYLSSVLTLSGFGSYDGSVSAIDVTTGEIAWQKRFPGEACYSGTTTTAGNLVFVGRSTGDLEAYDATSGEKLWSFQTGAGANSTPAIFESGDTEYIAFYAAGNSLAASPHGDNLWLFSLNGTLGPAAAGGPAAQGEHAGEGDAEGAVEQEQTNPPAETQSQADTGSADGEAVFADNCSSCHGFDGTGGNGGPDLTAIPSAQDLNTVIDQITNGGGGMPAFSGQLTPEQIKDTAAYVVGTITGGK